MFLGSFVSMVAVGVFCAWKCSNPICKTLSTNVSFVAAALTSVSKQKTVSVFFSLEFFYISSCREVLCDSVAFFSLSAAEYKYALRCTSQNFQRFKEHA